MITYGTYWCIVCSQAKPWKQFFSPQGQLRLSCKHCAFRESTVTGRRLGIA